jgi:hypothetical protein
MAEWTDLKFIQKVRKSENTGDASIAENIYAAQRRKEDLLDRGSRHGIKTARRPEEHQEHGVETIRKDTSVHGGDINEFIAHMSKAEGYARQARFAVDIQLPGNLQKLADGVRGLPAIGIGFGEGPISEPTGGRAGKEPDKDAISMLQLAKSMGRQMNIHCDSISMPGHDMQTVKHTTFGPEKVIAVGHGYEGTITASFYADLYLRERHYLEMWQRIVVNNLTHKAGYYDDYIGSMRIYQLDNNGWATYGIEATEVYPEQISAVSYDYSRASSIVKLTCEFQYRQWYNLTTENINRSQYNQSG